MTDLDTQIAIIEIKETLDAILRAVQAIEQRVVNVEQRVLAISLSTVASPAVPAPANVSVKYPKSYLGKLFREAALMGVDSPTGKIRNVIETHIEDKIIIDASASFGKERAILALEKALLGMFKSEQNRMRARRSKSDQQNKRNEEPGVNEGTPTLKKRKTKIPTSSSVPPAEARGLRSPMV